MKSLIYLIFISLLIACNNSGNKSTIDVEDINNPATADNPTAEPSEFPVMTFEKNLHEFGDVLEGAKAVYDYKFTNTGKADLIIDNCEAQCGCTVPEWPREVIKPGEKGKITVEFNSSGKGGFNTKTITIYSNVKEKSQVLTFTANVYSAK